MAKADGKQAQTGQTKKIILQDLLNFSDSSEDEQVLDDVLAASVNKSEKCVSRNTLKSTTLDKENASTEKENAPKESASRKKKGAETERITGLKLSKNSAARKHCKTKEKSAAVQEECKSVKEKESKKTVVSSKPITKRRPDFHNMTLASLGVSLDFSGSSDDEEKRDKEQIALALRKNKKPQCDLQLLDIPKQSLTNPLKGGTTMTNAHSEKDITDQVRPNHEKLDVPSCTKKASISKNKVQSSKVSKAASPVDDKPSSELGMKDKHPTQSSSKTAATTFKLPMAEGNTVATSAKSVLTGVMKGDRKTCKPSPLLANRFPLQHLNVSMIKSDHLLTNSLLDASPSEESLLPLSESTRLDCPESVSAPNQSFGHLLAHDYSPLLFDSHISRDSSYEQLKIVVKKDDPETNAVPDQHEENRKDRLETLTNNVSAEHGQIKKTSLLEDTQTASAVETSENDSHYMTCLATPDVSSMYEVVDVSAQTSFKFGVSSFTKEEDGAVFTKHTSDKSANDDQFKLNRNSVNKAELLEEQMEDKPSFDASAKSVPAQMSTAEKQKHNHDCNEDGNLPDLSSDSCPKQKSTNKQRKITEAHEEMEDMSKSSNTPESRPKLPSDSNYYSESSGSQNTVQGNPGQSHNHDAFVSMPGLLKSTNVSRNGEPELEDQEGEEADYLLSDTPEACLSAIGKSTEGLGKHGMSGTPRRQTSKRNEDSSSEDDSDDRLEKFFQKLRTPAQPAKRTDEDDDDIGNFIVNDSDVTDSDEDVCYTDLTRSPGVDDLLECLPRTRLSRKKTATSSSHRSTATHASSSEDSSDPFNSDVDSDGNDDKDKDDDEENGDSDCFTGFKTPRSKVAPNHSRSQTPRHSEADSPKWYTPATSIKPKLKQRDDRRAKGATSATAQQVGGDDCEVRSTPAYVSQRAGRHTTRPFNFLRSLSGEVPDHLRDHEARDYIVHFKKKQEELSSRLLKLFNFTVFENQLPEDVQVVWNKRLLKTAGLCKQKRVGDKYIAFIELSTKVCDTAERVRDTMIHEMCHAAVWILNKAKEGHGPHWRYWARKANRAHPEIPIIRRCHDYSISTKYIYRCVQCGYQIGRHSKSLDTERKVCGHCRGRFQLLLSSSRAGSNAPSLTATPRTPNPFALFVKENYGSMKRERGGLPHKEVMEALSREFAKTKISFSKS